jgi:large subunit ribosomal protein L24
MKKESNTQKIHIRKGDTVQLIAGNDKGKSGRVTKIVVDKQRAVVEGLNMVTKHVKPTANKPQGELLQVEGTVHISNLMLVEPSTGKATRTGRKENDKGKLQRYSKATGNFIADPK